MVRSPLSRKSRQAELARLSTHVAERVGGMSVRFVTSPRGRIE